MSVLLVEDDVLLGEGMHSALQRERYAVTWVKDGEAALAAAAANQYSCILLDMRIPKIRGLDVLRRIRARGDRTPVIIVTANERTHQKIEGLDAGADDYLVKPFDLAELSARVRAQVRRHDKRTTDTLTSGPVSLDLVGRTATLNDNPIALTAKEYRVLAHLMRRSGRFVTKQDLESELYDSEFEFESNTIEVTIYALRRKLGARFIVTGRGLGYMVAR